MLTSANNKRGAKHTKLILGHQIYPLFVERSLTGRKATLVKLLLKLLLTF